MSDTPLYDFAVVGAGLTGVSLAYGLARLGKSVVVLERLDKSEALNQPAHGLLWLQGGVFAGAVQREWNALALARWGDFDEQLCHISASVTHFERPGGLWLATDALALQGRQLQADAVTAEEPELEWLDQPTLQRLVHRFSGAVQGGSYCADDAQVNLQLLHRSMNRALHNLDVGLCYLHAVEELQACDSGYRLRGEGFAIEAQQVVMATGGQSADLATEAGFEPLHTVVDTLWESEQTRYFMPFPAWQLRQSRDGSLFVPVGEAGAQSEAWQVASAALGGLPESAVKRCWRDTRCATATGLPQYERSSTCAGVFRVASPEALLHCSLHAGPVSAWLAGKLSDQALLPFIGAAAVPAQQAVQAVATTPSEQAAQNPVEQLNGKAG